MRKLFAVLAVTAAVTLTATMARSGHEVPVYPSYYPHEIEIKTTSPEGAAGALRESKIHAYIGAEPRFPGGVPASNRAVESLGGFAIIDLNPASPLAADGATACATVTAIARGMAKRSAGEGNGFVFHPYPVTPFHGDYLFHADLAATAKERFTSAPAGPPAPSPEIVASGVAIDLIPPEWAAHGAKWDATLRVVDAAELTASTATSVNGWLGPPWARSGWFHAALLLDGAAEDPETGRRAGVLSERLKANEQRDKAGEINLQRDLVTALTSQCRRTVAGYTVKREYVSTEFTEGVENIGFDSIAGLNSPMFVRTVKLKNFPWNGWLRLGVNGRPDAAWNPIAGFTGAFGRLLWSAIGDPALLRSPYDSGWMVNRISDVQSDPGH